MTDAEIIAVVAKHPQGVTSQQVAVEIGRKLGNVSSRLSKLHAYGKINRRAVNHGLYPWRGVWIPKGSQMTDDSMSARSPIVTQDI